MIGPALSVIAAIILYAVINFAITSTSPESTNQQDLFGETSMFKTITNILLFLLSSIGMLAFIPCLIAGIVILHRRRNPQPIEATTQTPRSWKDIE